VRAVFSQFVGCEADGRSLQRDCATTDHSSLNGARSRRCWHSRRCDNDRWLGRLGTRAVKAMSGSVVAQSRCKERPLLRNRQTAKRPARTRRRLPEDDAANLTIRDGVISSSEDSQEEYDVRHPGQTIMALSGRQAGHHGRRKNAANKGVGACFVEVEVDTWTGNWRFVRSVYTHDTGLVINPRYPKPTWWDL